MFTAMHLVINQQGVNYYHAPWHYRATFCFVLFSLQSAARTDVVRARSDTNPGFLPQLPLVSLVISGLSGSLFFLSAINLHVKTLQYSFPCCIILHMKMLKMCIAAYVHRLINMHTICMQITPLEIATITITSAYYLLRCNSSRRPAGV